MNMHAMYRHCTLCMHNSFWQKDDHISTEHGGPACTFPACTFVCAVCMLLLARQIT